MVSGMSYFPINDHSRIHVTFYVNLLSNSSIQTYNPLLTGIYRSATPPFHHYRSMNIVTNL